ncbi:hypothetical protein WN48_00852 [Eufriesea mexicana]|nr:hypothetical protein WN48_00852 [Eufriesea mexicana]
MTLVNNAREAASYNNIPRNCFTPVNKSLLVEDPSDIISQARGVTSSRLHARS